jgi:hypothetical protein
MAVWNNSFLFVSPQARERALEALISSLLRVGCESLQETGSAHARYYNQIPMSRHQGDAVGYGKGPEIDSALCRASHSSAGKWSKFKWKEQLDADRSV